MNCSLIMTQATDKVSVKLDNKQACLKYIRMQKYRLKNPRYSKNYAKLTFKRTLIRIFKRQQFSRIIGLQKVYPKRLHTD